MWRYSFHYPLTNGDVAQKTCWYTHRVSGQKATDWNWTIEIVHWTDDESAVVGPPKYCRSLAWEPRVDLLESAESIILVVELAGVARSHIEVILDPATNKLHLSGQRHFEPQGAQKAHLLEIYYGEFSRCVELPSTGVAIERVEASLQQGMLRIELPKATERVRSSRKIDIFIKPNQ